MRVQIGGAVVSSLLMPGGGVGVQAPEASPGRYVRHNGEVPPDDDGDVLGVQVRGPGDDPFDIPAKRAPVERLRRWRVSHTLPTQLMSIGHIHQN